MDAVWINFFYHPLLPLGILISVLATFVFLNFLRGFSSGVLYLLTLNGNDDFLKAARIRVLWSFLLLVLLFCIWQMLQWLGAILTGGPSPRGLGLAQFFLICLTVIIVGVRVWRNQEKKAE